MRLKKKKKCFLEAKAVQVKPRAKGRRPAMDGRMGRAGDVDKYIAVTSWGPRWNLHSI